MEKLLLSRSNTTEANDGSEETFNTGTPTSITVSSLFAGMDGILQADTGSSNTSCSLGPAKSSQDSNLGVSDGIDIGGMMVWEQRKVCGQGSLVSVHPKATCDGVITSKTVPVKVFGSPFGIGHDESQTRESNPGWEDADHGC